MREILNNKKLILGSQSPRRAQLLKEIDLPFEQRVIEVEEIYDPTMPLEKVPEFLAELKAEAHISSLNDDEIILTSDTVVYVNNTILGKPKSTEQALEYLSMISNNIHFVRTGVCLLSKDKKATFSDVSEVKLVPLEPSEIEYYITHYQPFDKAGAYGIQEWFGHTQIDWIKGSYTNIMGLPTRIVYEELRSFCH